MFLDVEDGFLLAMSCNFWKSSSSGMKQSDVVYNAVILAPIPHEADCFLIIATVFRICYNLLHLDRFV